MTAGVPGTGIGGFFYMLTALWMPFRETGRALRGESSGARWRLIALQGAIALGVIASAWATGWLLALVIPPAWLDRRGGNLLRITPVILQAATLSLVFAGVHTLRFVTRLWPRTVASAPSVPCGDEPAGRGRAGRVLVLLGVSCLGQLAGAEVCAQPVSLSVHLPPGYDFTLSR